MKNIPIPDENARDIYHGLTVSRLAAKLLLRELTRLKYIQVDGVSVFRQDRARKLGDMIQLLESLSGQINARGESKGQMQQMEKEQEQLFELLLDAEPQVYLFVLDLIENIRNHPDYTVVLVPDSHRDRINEFIEQLREEDHGITQESGTGTQESPGVAGGDETPA